MITCVKKDTHAKKIDRPNRIVGKLVQRMSNKIKFVNYGGCNSKCYFISETRRVLFSKKFFESGKYQVNMCHSSYFMEHSVSKENNQGPNKNRIPAALKRDRNTNSFKDPGNYSKQ